MISYHNRQVAHREIDHIFQDLFPSHGMTARPIQIELSHKMLDNQLRGLECYSCKLDGKALNSVFTKLFEVPKDNPGYEKTYFISYYGNPGEENCDKGLLKGWYIVKDPTDK